MNRRLLAFVFLSGAAAIIYLFYQIPTLERTVPNFFTLTGTYLSIFGLAIAFIQIASIKVVAEQINNAVAANTRKISQLLSISDLATAIKIIQEIQTYLIDNKLELVRLRMVDLKLILIKMKFNSDLALLTATDEYQSIIANVSIDLNNISNTLSGIKKGINIGQVNTNLERIETILSNFENTLKYR